MKENDNNPTVPDKVTVHWLIDHVPVKLWLTALSLCCAVFVGGIQASRISVVREIFHLDSQVQTNTPLSKDVPASVPPVISNKNLPPAKEPSIDRATDTQKESKLGHSSASKQSGKGNIAEQKEEIQGRKIEIIDEKTIPNK